MKCSIILGSWRELSKKMGGVQWSRYVIRLREKLGKRRLSAHFKRFYCEGQLGIRSRLFKLQIRDSSAPGAAVPQP